MTYEEVVADIVVLLTVLVDIVAVTDLLVDTWPEVLVPAALEDRLDVLLAVAVVGGRAPDGEP